MRAGLPEADRRRRADAVTIDDYLIERPSQTVLVRVKGDSMMDAGIFEGDLVVVEKRAAAQKGDIVVAIVDNQFTLKRLDIEHGQFILRPENKAYPVIRPEGALEIFGVMVGLVRKSVAARRLRRRVQPARPRPGNRRTSRARPMSVSAWLGHRVGVVAVRRELLPPDRRRDDDARPRAVGHPRGGQRSCRGR